MKSKPIAVCISDIHYNIHTLQLADASMRQAIARANELDVHLIVAGDLHDTKANLRGECANAMIETFKTLNRKAIVLVGNHDKINEKASENSLNFLQAYTLSVVDKSTFWNLRIYSKGIHPNIYTIPYHHDSNELRVYLKTVPKGSTLIMHQGLIDSNAGHYIQDKSAITKEDVAGMRVISGHYHTRQTIDLPEGGKWSYLGNPYSLNFGEANDPPKGYSVLMYDGSLEFVPTNLRKHVVIVCNVGTINSFSKPNYIKSNDLVWVKVEGSKEHLALWNKERISKELGISQSFKLDLIPTDTTTDKTIQKENKTQPQILDSLIDSLTETSDTKKLRLKYLWKEFTE
jgi:DNA repair exonuclease SbcCD nuclease subunit